MPRCAKCHSQWATLFRCPHCDQNFPCPLQLFAVSAAAVLIVIIGIYLLFSFAHKIKDWRAVEKSQPVKEKSLTVEIDKSGVE
ncbi:MAG: hypothetical protein JHD33_11710 [Chthoniobacterales bacterium]|jgi:hypothetical protein|nr:hypothetical protein [Chthoniobacterales bacterium]